MLLVKRELWRGPLCRHLSLQLPEIVAGMALQLEPVLWSRGGGAGAWRPREGNWEQYEKKQRGEWPRILCRNKLWCFPEADLPKPIGIVSSWFLLNPFIILRMG